MEIVLIAAVSENGIIGREGDMPWRLKTDLRHFRERTIGKPVVMGRKTFVSLGQPLKGRTNIVLSRNPEFEAAGCVVAGTIAQALEVARGDALRRGVDEIMIGGGSHLYRALLPSATRIELTRVHLSVDGDTAFPPIDEQQWAEVAREEPPQGSEDSARVTWLSYRRKG